MSGEWCRGGGSRSGRGILHMSLRGGPLGCLGSGSGDGTIISRGSREIDFLNPTKTYLTVWNPKRVIVGQQTTFKFCFSSSFDP